MTRDPETLKETLKYILFVAAFFATAFPVMYAFSPWYKSALGKVLMLHGFALAFALDVTLLFYFWQPKDILIVFWIEVVIFALIALANFMICLLLWRNNYSKRSINEPA